MARCDCWLWRRVLQAPKRLAFSALGGHGVGWLIGACQCSDVNHAKRCTVYLRVSTDKQTVENQAAEVRRMVDACGYVPVVYEETESAAKSRPVLDE